MLKTLFTIILLLFVLTTKAQTQTDTTNKDIPGTDSIFTAVEVVPEFPGGPGAFGNFLAHKLRYPAKARENNITGRVFVTFVVEPNGSLTDIRILRGIGAGCDEEVIRVLKLSPKWKPGIQNDRPVRVQYNVPVMFNLDVSGGSVWTRKKEKIKLPVKDTLVQFYKFPDVMVYNKNEADYIAFIYPPVKDANKLYPFKQFYVNGKIKFNGYLSQHDGELCFQGQCVEYYPQGTKMAIASYNLAGQKNGSEYLFYPNGSLYCEKQYHPVEGDKYTRLITCNDSLGTSIARAGNGEWIEYDGEFKIITNSGPVKDGFPIGDWTFWKNDSTKIISNYVNGNVNSQTTYFKVEGQYLSINELPMYKGDYRILNDYLRKKTKLPKKAYENNKLGIVLVGVTVMPDGTFANVEVEQALGFDCDEEAIRVIRSTEPWVPNSNLKKPVKIYFPVNFRYAGDISDGFNFPPSLSVD